ncbi:MAG: hypothetical protein ACLP51_08765 [Syntrophobacteraceae bacterium]
MFITVELISSLLLNELPPQSGQSEIEKHRQAGLISEEMIVHNRFDPS